MDEEPCGGTNGEADALSPTMEHIELPTIEMNDGSEVF
jgi:hypothetical protein|tara:strand:- start:267 stop:380 length:114 start_codon:yes stop_codon:yes gene_type:complete